MSEEIITLARFQVEIARISQWAEHGCGDSGCVIKRPKGMATNGGCRCRPREFAEILLYLACEVDKHGRYKTWPKEQPTQQTED